MIRSTRDRFAEVDEILEAYSKLNYIPTLTMKATDERGKPNLAANSCSKRSTSGPCAIWLPESTRWTFSFACSDIYGWNSLIIGRVAQLKYLLQSVSRKRYSSWKPDNSPYRCGRICHTPSFCDSTYNASRRSRYLYTRHYNKHQASVLSSAKYPLCYLS